MSRFGLGDWDAAVARVRTADDVALACHVNPDGDALGSLLALSLGLRALGKKTYASWSAPSVELPAQYSFLPGAEALVPVAEVPASEVFVALDCGAADRLGDLEAMATAAPVLVNVDHHDGNPNFGKFNLVVPTASSTAEIMLRLLEDLGVTIDRAIATCLYTGIVTDTGRFQYANSTPDTLRIAADLLEHGVPHSDIAQEVFESSPFAYMKLVGRVLDRATLHDDARLVYSWITLDDLSETGVAREETDTLIDLVRSTRAAEVAAMFKEQDDGTWRVSLRSKGPSVGAIARARGGGGHERAAGFTARDMTETIDEIRRALTTTSP